MAWQQDDHVAVAGWISSCSPTLTWSMASLRRFAFGVSGAHVGMVTSMELFWVLELLCGQPILLLSLLGFVARMMGQSRVCTFPSHPHPHPIPPLWIVTNSGDTSTGYIVAVRYMYMLHFWSALLHYLVFVHEKKMRKKKVNVLASNVCLMIKFSAYTVTWRQEHQGNIQLACIKCVFGDWIQCLHSNVAARTPRLHLTCLHQTCVWWLSSVLT